MIYYTIELQSGAAGAAIVNAYTDVADAREKYFEILKFAVKSTVRKHGAIVVDENGFVVEPARIFDHSEPAEQAE